MVTTDGTPFGDLALNVFCGPDTGPPLVFVHGVLRCWQDFRPLFPYFSYDWTCYSLDHRGHGESEHSPGDYEVLDYVSDVQQFVETQFDEPVVMYGHSLGAMVVAAVAAKLDDKVMGAILEDPPFETMGTRIGETSLLSYFQGIKSVVTELREPWEIGPALAEVEFFDPVSKTTKRVSEIRNEVEIMYAAKCLSRIDPTVLDPIVEGRWLNGYDLADISKSIPCPTLLLQGDPDQGGMLIDEDVAIMKQKKPNLFHVKYNGAGHQLHWTNREEVLRAVSSFLITP